jgi:ferredoxin-NADP reductase/Na+-translocating ferredoxin:NAD+ oxidoreductase RnfD subunit
MQAIDNVLNTITMYRLVIYVLSALTILGIGVAFLGHLSTSGTSMVISLVLILVSTYVSDRGFGRLFQVPTNSDSWLITALILFLIIHPESSLLTALALILAGVVSSASKFLLTIHDKHVFNPAALAAGLLSLTGLQATTWWIGSSIFWPATLTLGLLVVRKIRRFPLVLTFIGGSIVVQAGLLIASNQPFVINMQHALFSSPLIFLATIMLTEPATMPPRRNQQIIFGLITAVLYITAWKIGPFIIYPEIALVLANIYAYMVSPKLRLRLKLKKVQRISEHVYNYVFEPDRYFSFIPGQYMEWTLAGVPYDSRGNRRSFTIASSPSEETVQLGIKYYEPSSMYKSVFASLKPGAIVYASQLAGSFTLEKNNTQKLVFIAGGIGITPFRSMIKDLTDANVVSNIALIYVVNDPAELAYMDVFEAARKIGVEVVPVITRSEKALPGMLTGRLTREMISNITPDFSERMFYISGPNVMVDEAKAMLLELGLSSSKIKTDHFSGY